MLGSFILGDYALQGAYPRAVHHAVFSGLQGHRNGRLCSENCNRNGQLWQMPPSQALLAFAKDCSTVPSPSGEKPVWVCISIRVFRFSYLYRNLYLYRIVKAFQAVLPLLPHVLQSCQVQHFGTWWTLTYKALMTMVAGGRGF